MGIMENAIDQAFARLSQQEKAEMLTTVATRLLEKMSAEDRYALADKIVDTLIGDLAPDERKAAVSEFLPRMIARAVEQSGLGMDELMSLAFQGVGMLESQADNTHSTSN